MAALDIENSNMFCFQCEQTAKGEACTVKGVCTKDASVAALQDHLMYGLQSIGFYGVRVVDAGIKFPESTPMFVSKALFSTLTNVNFAPEDFVVFLKEAEQLRNQLKGLLPALTDKLPAVATWTPKFEGGIPALVEQARDYLIPKRFAVLGKDRVCLQELLMYGLKGLAAYLFHALVLGEKDEAITKFMLKALAFVHKEDPAVDELLGMCMECGKVNLDCMALLDKANTNTYGHPEPTKVLWAKTPKGGIVGKAILVSGHDLLELEKLLKATEGKGVNIWTHGEMLPCNAYPGLKKYKHFVGHYGTAWQNQKKEFEAFPGPILMTTNCYIPAPESYLHRVFSCSPVGGVSVKPVDYAEMTKIALEMPGFSAPTEEFSLTVGFARNTVLNVAGTVIDAVKSKALRHIFLIGGCDGFEKERNYYTELAERVPNDCLILTLACGKFKINAHDYGTLGGLPRLLDMGQCNDAYSAIVVAVELAKAFGVGVNDLPLTLVLSWFEQKAVVILLTLLSLGIKNIYVGPRVPAFFTPTILGVLVDKFQLHVVGNPETDLKTILKL